MKRDGPRDIRGNARPLKGQANGGAKNNDKPPNNRAKGGPPNKGPSQPQRGGVSEELTGTVISVAQNGLGKIEVGLLVGSFPMAFFA